MTRPDRPASTASRIRPLAVNLALSLGALLVVFAFAEAAVRLLLPPLETHGTYSRRTEEPYGYELIPGASAVVSNKSVHVNSLGFRDRERTVAKLPRTRRIVVIGDSHVFGEGVADEEVFTRVLERSLETSAAEDRPVEVLNLGVFGYNTTQEVHLLERRGLAFGPDLVIVLYTLSDVLKATLPVPAFRAGAQPPGDGKTASGSGPEPSRRKAHERRFGRLGRYRDLIRRSALARLVYYRLAALTHIGGTWGDLYTPSSEGWLEAQAALRHAAELSRRHRFRLLLAIHPELVRLADYPHTRAHAALRTFCDAEGIPVLDLLPAYAGHEATSLWIHPEDRHPNAEGHRLIARALFAYLRENPDLLIEAPRR